MSMVRTLRVGCWLGLWLTLAAASPAAAEVVGAVDLDELGKVPALAAPAEEIRRLTVEILELRRLRTDAGIAGDHARERELEAKLPALEERRRAADEERRALLRRLREAIARVAREQAVDVVVLQTVLRGSRQAYLFDADPEANDLLGEKTTRRPSRDLTGAVRRALETPEPPN
jgi:hypothetical protein